MDSLVVTVSAVASVDDSIRLVDVREPWEYESIGHLPGAVNVPFDSYRNDGDSQIGMLPQPSEWATLLGEAGISPEDTIVAYDDMHGVFAARFVVTALMYGHQDVHLLDGDYSSWSRHHPTSIEQPTIPSREYPIPELDETFLVSAGAVEAAAESDEAVVVDTRSPDEFQSGHIAGAVNLDWITLVDESDRGLREESALRTILNDHGITPEKRVILYCNTARRISHTYIVLRHLGYERVEFFEGSLTAWRAADRPLATGSADHAVER